MVYFNFAKVNYSSEQYLQKDHHFVETATKHIFNSIMQTLQNMERKVSIQLA